MNGHKSKCSSTNRNVSGVLLDRLLATRARRKAAYEVAIGEYLAVMAVGNRTLTFGYVSLGDYARERLGINARTAQVQTELWSAVLVPAAAKPTPMVALAVSGMNDVLNSRGYTQAAWWNRIPLAAWGLMATIAICCNVLIGYRARNVKAEAIMLLVLPLVVSISFFLIADIDSPRGGVIRVNPHNLVRLVESLGAH